MPEVFEFWLLNYFRVSVLETGMFEITLRMNSYPGGVLDHTSDFSDNPSKVKISFATP